MKILRDFLAVLLFVAGIVAALYVGIYIMFVCGIIQVVEAVRAQPDWDAAKLAWGIARIVFASPAGYVVAMISIFLSKLLAS